MRVLGDRVLVKRNDTLRESPGGIMIPDVAQRRAAMGKVLAVGEGSSLGVGEIILFGQYAGTDVEIGDEDYTVLKEEEILVVL